MYIAYVYAIQGQLNIKKLAKLSIILVCTKLQSLNVTLCTYRKKLKSRFWSDFFWYSRYIFSEGLSEINHWLMSSNSWFTI